MDYLKLLEYSFNYQNKIWEHTNSRLEYLGEYIFNFTTYDSEISEFFTWKALEVCQAINDEKTYEYIKDFENYVWFLLMCNMPFFAEKIEWGISIRGAWWDFNIEFDSCGLWEDKKQLTNTMKFTQAEWKLFISAMIEFAKKEDK